MNTGDSQPKLPTWIFILADLALLGTAVLIAATSTRPFTSEAMLWMSLCVIGGAAVGLVPIVVRYERQKNEVLDERQRALEALARTVYSSAEQISIATGGLHEIAEMAQKNLRHAEQLPQKLQEKVAELQAQIGAADEAHKEELERELLALRTSESERLETVSQRIAKSSAEWAKLEAAVQQHLAAATEALAKLSLGTASAIGKAQAAAEQALAQARTEAARGLGEASGAALRDLEAAKAAARAEMESTFATAATAAVEHATRTLAEKIAAATRPLDDKLAQLEAAARAHAAAAPAPDAATDAPPEDHAPAPKRPRKPRRDEPAAAAPDAPSVTPPADAITAPAAEPPPPSAPPPAAEPAPVPAEKIAEVAPIAPATAEPFPTPHETPPPSAPPEPAPSAPPVAAAAAPATPRRRARKSDTAAAPSEPAPMEEPSLGLELDAGNGPAEAGVVERVLTSDGATRLLVTAYIGIGNRLFIRGAGPGLTWEKGVPLQFVSIGKWRWETNDASAPVQFKLYKNDELECAALGAQTLDPGHQQEVTAAF